MHNYSRSKVCAWHGRGVSLVLAPDGKAAKRKRARQWIEVAWHEWVELRADARAHGLSTGKFILLVWRNWRTERKSLALIPELPVEPWKRSA